MLRIISVVLSLLVLVASPAAAEGNGPSSERLELEGIYLGQPFADVDRLLDLGNYTPVMAEGAERYTWRPHGNIQDLKALDMNPGQAHRLRSIDLVFHDSQVSEVRVTYAGAALFARIGPELEERYGQASAIHTPPERSVTGGDGKPYSLSLQIWTWRWADATLMVTGENYRGAGGNSATGENRHDLFRFHLVTPPGSSTEP
jgi:hypothetical protein